MWVSDSLLPFWLFSPGEEKGKKKSAKGNRCEKKAKEELFESISTFFFLKIILEPVCLQRNQQKDGGK